MNEPESKSEVARLMKRIEMEYEAAQQAMNGLAFGASKHEFITARMEKIGQCHEELQTLVGEDEAIKLVYEAQVNIVGE